MLLRRQLTIAVVEQRHPLPQGSLQRGFAPAPHPPATASESLAAATTEEIDPMTPCILISPAARRYVATNVKAAGSRSNALIDIEERNEKTAKGRNRSEVGGNGLITVGTDVSPLARKGRSSVRFVRRRTSNGGS